MKLLIIFFCIFTISYCQDDLGVFSDHEKQCLQSTNIDETMLNNALKQLYMPEYNEQLNKFIECTWIKDGYIDTNGKINFEKFTLYVKSAYMEAVGMAELAEAFSKDTVSYCRNTEGNSPGQLAVKLLNCILKRLYL